MKNLKPQQASLAIRLVGESWLCGKLSTAAVTVMNRLTAGEVDK